MESRRSSYVEFNAYAAHDNLNKRNYLFIIILEQLFVLFSFGDKNNRERGEKRESKNTKNERGVSIFENSPYKYYFCL